MEIHLVRKNKKLNISNSFLEILTRRECKNSYQCKYGKICKYKHVKTVCLLDGKIFIKGKWSDLSGTILCPYKMHRLYTCWDCNNCSGILDGECLNPNKKNEITYNDPDWGPHHRCTGFDPVPWCNDWSRQTGDRIYR